MATSSPAETLSWLLGAATFIKAKNSGSTISMRDMQAGQSPALPSETTVKIPSGQIQRPTCVEDALTGDAKLYLGPSMRGMDCRSSDQTRGENDIESSMRT